MRTFSDLFGFLLAGDETAEIEAKRGSDVGKALFFSITAFANEPGLGGGYFLLGVARPSPQAPYEIVGVTDPDKLQRDLVAHCSTDFNVVIRPEMAVEIIDGKPVVIAQIHEADPNENRSTSENTDFHKALVGASAQPTNTAPMTTSRSFMNSEMNSRTTHRS
jgi:ATP-dependent DNA helicase RecG